MAITVSGILTGPDGSPLPFLNIIIKAVQSVPGASGIPNQALAIEQSSATGAYSFTLEEGVYAISLSGGGLGQPVSLGQAVVNSSSLATDLITLIGASGVPTSTIQAAIVVASQQAATTVAVGTTTTGAAGTAAAVTNGGTATALQLDFVVPAGVQGVSGLGSTVANGTYTAATATVSGGQITALANNPIVNASTGAANAGDIVALNAAGLVDISMTSAFIKFRAYRNAALSLVAGQTTLPLDTVAYNSTSDTILQTNGTIMVPVAGYYHVDGVIGLHPTASGTDVTGALIIEKGGSVNVGESIYGFQGRIDGVLSNANMATSGIIYLLPTDTLYISIYVQAATSIYSGNSAMNFLSIYGPL